MYIVYFLEIYKYTFKLLVNERGFLNNSFVEFSSVEFYKTQNTCRSMN